MRKLSKIIKKKIKNKKETKDQYITREQKFRLKHTSNYKISWSDGKYQKYELKIFSILISVLSACPLFGKLTK